MSAAVVDSSSDFESDLPGEPFALRVFFWAISGFVVLLLWRLVIRDLGSLQSAMPGILAWALVIAMADSLPVRFWGPVTLTMSLPVTLAVGMLFLPVPAALATFLVSFDTRELKGEVSLSRALFNRSQICLSVLFASLAFHGLGGEAGSWPGVLVPAIAALTVDFVVNTSLVVIAASLAYRRRPRVVLARVLHDSPAQYLFGYVVLGFFALLLATVGALVGAWGAVAFLAPLALARLTFTQTQRLSESGRQLEERNAALTAAIQSMADERRDERVVMAGVLHDEVLPPLFKVHLMGQVLRQDLIAGRLLDLDDDLPELLSATQAAQEAVREVVGDLRRSAVGPDGLNATVARLAAELESTGDTRFSLDLQEVGGSKLLQLLTYQVAREAMTNCARHSAAAFVEVGLWLEAGEIRLMVEDNGVGFDTHGVNRDSHFGLQLIRERIQAVGGTVIIDSMPGQGTRVLATLPRDI